MARSTASGRPPRRAGLAARAIAAALAAASPALAADADGPRLELNRLEPQGEACRVTLLVANARPEPYRSLKVDLFALDTAGVAQRRLAVELGPVAARKTLIKLFDVPDLPCGRFGQLLLNDVIACDGPTGSRDACLAAIEIGSRVAAVAFVK